jgi:hypothetical protein
VDKVLDGIVETPWTISTYPHKSRVFFTQRGSLWAAVDSSVDKETMTDQRIRRIVHNPQDLLPLLHFKTHLKRGNST